MISAGVKVTGAPVGVCSEQWGFVHFQAFVDDRVQVATRHFRMRLALWAAMTKAKDARYDAWWASLPRFFIGQETDVAQSAASKAHDRGLLLLLIMFEGQPIRQFVMLCGAAGLCQARRSTWAP